MKITDIRVHILKKDLSTSMRISRGGFKVRKHCIVQIVTDDGVYGLGEGVGNPQAIKALIENCMTTLLLGANCMSIEALVHKLMTDTVYFERGGSWVCAVSAIETALWDIKGKYLNCPVYELLGGKSRPELEVYASDVYWYEDTQLVARDIERILEKGIRNVKLHTGVLGPREEFKRLAEIGDLLRSTDRFMIDLNCAYSLPDAMLAVKYFSELNPFWIEEPLALNCEDQLPRLRAISPVPIAYGENIVNPEGFRRVIQNGGLDVAMPDIARIGGIKASLDVLSVAQAFGVQTSYHNFSSGVLLAATAHLMAARSEQALLEYDSSENSVLHEFVPGGFKIRDGKLTVPSGPGLGVELTEAVLRCKE